DVLGGSIQRRDRPDLSHPGAACRTPTAFTDGEQPDFSLGFDDRTILSFDRFGRGTGRVSIEMPIKRPAWQLTQFFARYDETTDLARDPLADGHAIVDGRRRRFVVVLRYRNTGEECHPQQLQGHQGPTATFHGHDPPRTRRSFSPLPY